MPKQPPARPPRKPSPSMKALERTLDELSNGDNAATRLVQYIATYPEYLDRDRDILLLNIYRMLKGPS